MTTRGPRRRPNRRPGGFAVLLLIALAASVVPVFAQDDRGDPVRTILFGSLDAGPSTFFNSGAKVALDDVNREGFVALVSAGGGVRRERAPVAQGFTVPTLVRTTLLGSALAGYQFFAEWGVVSLFAGPEASIEALAGNGEFRTLPARFGLRAQGELWARPSENTLTTATLVLGSARWDLYARVSAGYRLWGAYLGPEATTYGDRTGYRKLSLGLHATDFAFGAVSFRVSGGALYESQTGRIGPYVAFAAWTPL